jgi:hypothetical protein
MSTQDWLATLKTGDEVVVYGSYGDCIITTVKHTTATLIDVGTSRFQRKNGRRLKCDKWSRAHLAEPTDAIRQQIRREQVLSSLRAFDWRRLSNDTLFAIHDMVGKGQAA